MPDTLQSLTLIVASGIIAQWVAWRIGLPSILLLLIAGFLLGPVSGLLKPDDLAGGLLMPVVSLSVALILFEGGLSLKFSEIKTTGHVVRNLVTTGALITLVLAATTARFLLGWEWGQALLFGSILTVTGPTVIAPLLRHVQPSRQIASILKWEGIVIDPIGAMFALLVFEVVTLGVGAHHSPVTEVLLASAKIVGIGSFAGAAGAGLLIFLLRRYWIPDYLQNPFTLMVVVVAFTGSNSLQHESGLFAVTLMGVILANQKWVKTGHILEFKENLRVLLIAVLFVVLAARVERSQIEDMPWLGASLVLLVLVIFVRPAAVILSSLRSPLSLRERAFVASIAPRGIVAAAIASLFADKLASEGFVQSGQLVPVIFFIIVGTVAIYGLGASPLAKLLKVSNPDPQGCLIVGAHPFARAVAKTLAADGFRTVVVDSNRNNVATAKLEGIEAHYGSVLSSEIEEELDLAGIGRLLALTPNSEINSLACLHFKHHFGTENTFHLPTHDNPNKRDKTVSPTLKNRILFSQPITYGELTNAFASGATVKKTNMTEEFTFEDFRSQYTDPVSPLFLITAQNRLRVFSTDSDLKPSPGDKLVSLVPTADNPT